MILLSYITSLLGLFLLIFCFCNKILSGVFGSIGQLHVNWFILCISWTLSIGLQGVIGLWGYRFDQPVEYVIVFNGIIGLFGIFFFLFYLKNAGSLSFSFSLRNFSASEKCALGLILFGFALYAYTAIAPWYEWDEMAHYGKEAKDYALGLTYSQRVVSGAFGKYFLFGSKLGEMLNAQAFYPVHDVYLGRLLRFVSMIFCFVGTFIFFRFLGVRRFWSLIGVASILFLMDLQKVGMSLKVDTFLMIFELTAFMFLILTLLSYRQEYQPLKNSRLVLAGMSLTFASLALATRTSGLYICFLTTSVAFAVGFTFKSSLSKKAVYFLILFGLLAIFNILYLFNFHNFGNPFYPLSGPWPFHHGQYAHHLSDWKKSFNIDAFPPVINQLYLLIHLALGISVIGNKIGINFPPGSPTYLAYTIRWLTPVLLTIFFLPFFWRRHFVIKMFGVVFIYWFTMWTLGAHYTRLFIAGAGVCIFLAVFIASLDKENLTFWQKRFQWGIRFLLLASLALFILLHIREVLNYPHNFKSLFSQRARYVAMLNQFENEEKNGLLIKSLPSFEEGQTITEALKKMHKQKSHAPIVQTEYSRVLHIYFDDGLFTEQAGPNGEFKILDVSDCYLGFTNTTSFNKNREMKRIETAFPKMVFDNGNIFLRCRN